MIARPGNPSAMNRHPEAASSASMSGAALIRYGSSPNHAAVQMFYVICGMPGWSIRIPGRSCDRPAVMGKVEDQRVHHLWLKSRDRYPTARRMTPASFEEFDPRVSRAQLRIMSSVTATGLGSARPSWRSAIWSRRCKRAPGECDSSVIWRNGASPLVGHGSELGRIWFRQEVDPPAKANPRILTRSGVNQTGES